MTSNRQGRAVATVAKTKSAKSRKPPRRSRKAERPLAQRSRTFEWRRRWFAATRGEDERELGRVRDAAVEHKRDLIERLGPESGQIAGYDPAGAGSPWYPIGPRNVNGRVRSLAIHPTNPNTLYAAAAAGGVWKSVDGGETWDPLWDMQDSLALGAIDIARSSPQTIYAGTGEWTPGYGASYPGVGVYVSTDGGATWSLRNSCRCRRIGKLIVDPGNAQRVWICGDAGLERTEDGGVTWTRLRTDTVSDIVLDPNNASTVFIAVVGSGAYKSTDRGDNFTLLSGSPTGAGVTFPQLAIGASGTHGSNFIVLKSGGTVMTSTDGGANFTTVATGHGGFFGWCDVIACAPDNESILFYGGIGLERSTNGGSTWSGLPVHADQHAAVFAHSNSNIVYFANDGGVWRSSDKGATVRKVSNGLVVTQFYDLGFWSPLSNVVGGGAQDNATNYTTSGLTWRPVWTNDGGWFVIDPTDPRIMYAEGQNAYLAKSIDGGTNWTPVTGGVTGTTPWEGVLTMDPNRHLRLFYGTDCVLRTKDGCATAWETVSQTLSGEVSSIAVAPPDSERVYAGTTNGKVYRSNDGGDTSTWADVSSGLPALGIASIWVDPGNKDIVLIGVGGTLSGGGTGVKSTQSVYRSANGGTSWTDVSGDLPEIVANSAVIDPSSATTFYVATDAGVYRTTNGGTNWLPFDNGIPNVPVSDLALDPTRKMLYAGTFGRGAYKLDLTPGITKRQVELYVRDHNLDTGSIVPSPSGLPDPLLPAPAIADWWTSPDIKVNHSPYYSPPGSVFDGVDFDATLVHQDPHRPATNRFYLQVHNRGWKATTNVSVRAFVADASLGLPLLPNSLTPPSFNLSSTTVWKPVGPAQTIATLQPNRPAVVSWDFNLPIGTATHTCCLAVVSSPDDPITSDATDIGTLVTGDRHVCLKNLHVVDAGPGPLPITILGINLHNPHDSEGIAELISWPISFLRGTIGLLLPRLELSSSKLSGVEPISLPPGDPIGRWYGNRKALNEGELKKLWRGLDRSKLWTLSSTQPSRLGGIRMRPRQTLRGAIVLSHKRDVPMATAPRVRLEQRIGRRQVGGSTFQIGYDYSAAPAEPKARRIRVVAKQLRWQAEGRSRPRLWLKATVDGDELRSSFSSLGDGGRLDEAHVPLFDGYLASGESLTLELFEAKPSQLPEEGQRLYEHRFDGLVHSWLGSRKASRKRGALQLHYTVEDVTHLRPIGAD
jgi:hypothetical protein